MLFYVLLCILLYLFYIYFTKPLNYWKERNVTSIPGWPIFGNFLSLVLGIESFADIVWKLYRQHPNARYVGYTQFCTPVLAIRDLDLLKEVTIKQFDHFMDHNGTDDVVHDIDPMITKSLFLLQGNRWKDMRITLSPTFTTRKMRAMYQLMQDIGVQFTKELEVEVVSGATPTYDFMDLMKRFANDVIASCAYGVQINSLAELDNPFYKLGSQSLQLKGWRGLKFLLLLTKPIILRILRISVFPPKATTYFKKIICENIEYREKNKLIRPDMLHLLMEARKGRLKHDDIDDDIVDAGFATVRENVTEKNKSEIKLTDEDIAAQAFLFFLGGFDTVSTQLYFLCQELAMNPHIQKTLQNEIDQVIETAEKPSYEVIVQLPYLDMVVSECLRKWPPGASIDRKCTKEYTIYPKQITEQSLVVEKGTIIAIPILGIHRDEKYYSDPEKFDPSRFSEENRKRLVPYSYLPFGQGPRHCIANRFALMEIKVFIFNFLWKFDVVVTNKTQIPIQYDPSGFSMGMKGGCWLGIKKRQ